MQIIKKAYSGEFRYLLAVIKRAALKDQKIIIFPKRKFIYHKIMRLLYTEGFIQSYEERGEFLIIRLKQTY